MEERWCEGETLLNVFFQKSEIALFWEYPMSFVNKSLGQAIEESAPTLGCVCSIIFPFAFSAKVIPADLTYQTQSENEKKYEISDLMDKKSHY